MITQATRSDGIAGDRGHRAFPHSRGWAGQDAVRKAVDASPVWVRSLVRNQGHVRCVAGVNSSRSGAPGRGRFANFNIERGHEENNSLCAPILAGGKRVAIKRTPGRKVPMGLCSIPTGERNGLPTHFPAFHRCLAHQDPIAACKNGTMGPLVGINPTAPFGFDHVCHCRSNCTGRGSPTFPNGGTSRSRVRIK